MKNASKHNLDMKKNASKDLAAAAKAAYDALRGLVSEHGPEILDGYAKGGGASLMNSLESALVAAGALVIAPADDPEFPRVLRAYTGPKGEVLWGIAWNSEGEPEWALTGLKTQADAEEALAMVAETPAQRKPVAVVGPDRKARRPGGKA